MQKNKHVMTKKTSGFSGFTVFISMLFGAAMMLTIVAVAIQFVTGMLCGLFATFFILIFLLGNLSSDLSSNRCENAKK